MVPEDTRSPSNWRFTVFASFTEIVLFVAAISVLAELFYPSKATRDAVARAD